MRHALLVALTTAALSFADGPARLAVKTVEGVRINIDQEQKGTGAASVAVSPGRHTVRIYDGERVVSEKLVDVRAGETLWVEFKVEVRSEPQHAPMLAPPKLTTPESFATVEVRSLNVAGDIAIDGVVVGWAPLKVRDLPVGEHTVEVLVDGVPVRTRRVNVKPSMTKLNIF